jgi:hypothetical protein
LLCISDELAPRQIQSISCNVRNRKKNFEIVVDPQHTYNVLNTKLYSTLYTVMYNVL